MNPTTTSPCETELWSQVRPVLDDAMHELNEKDRTTVVLRFFEDRSLKEVGVALGLTENAARMRVDRALDKLRDLLARRGIKSTGATLAAALVGGTILTPPSSLAATITGTALASAKAAPMAMFVSRVLAGLRSKAVVAGASAIVLGTIAVWYSARNKSSTLPQPATMNTTVQQTSSNTVAVAPAETNSAKKIKVATGPQMLFTVLEAETGNPLAGAKLWVAYFSDDDTKRLRPTTGINGAVLIPKKQGPRSSVNLFVAAAGHVPKCIKFRSASAMPDAYTVRLERATSIGGVVVDQSGHGIADVKMEISGPGSDQTSQEEIAFGPDAWPHTDATGHWSSDFIPKDLDKLRFTLTHPQHAHTESDVNLATVDRSHIVVTMSDGFDVAGRVTDILGVPLEGVKVRKIWIAYSLQEEATHTDASGRFDFKHTAPGETFLAARVDGYAPLVTNLQVNRTFADLHFQLMPGQLLRVRVVSDAGTPITNALMRTLGDDLGVDKVDWSARSTNDGMIEWNSAPVESLKYAIDAKGFNGAYGQALAADGALHEIKLSVDKPSNVTTISGTVTDAETGDPLDGFKVLMRKVDPDWPAPYSLLAMGKDGTFRCSQRAAQMDKIYQIKIEKDGYVPAVSGDLAGKDGDQNLSFKLQKGSGPSGTVLLPDGTPAANAAVYLCIPEAGVTLDQSRVQDGINTTTIRATTDENGNFTLPAAPQFYGVIAVHDKGYAETSLTTASSAVTITLQPWGAIHGSVTLDWKPAANEKIAMMKQDFRFDDRGRQSAFITAEYETTSDASGNFSFEKVRPGTYNIFRRCKVSAHGTVGYNSKEITVKPGETTEVQLGGGGRTVIGKVVLQDVNAPVSLTDVTVMVRLKDPNKPSEYPRHDQFATVDEYIAAAMQWDQYQDRARCFGAKCNADGTFRITDIDPGEYRLDVDVADYKINSVAPSKELTQDVTLASTQRDVTIPERYAGQANDPINVGTVVLGGRR